MSSRGVVAAGHPLTAEAGAQVLRDGGNAVDAAVAAVITSCVTESPLTGLGAGGYMLVHESSASELLDFFVAVPGSDGAARSSELVPIGVHFTPESSQTFHVGAASCGVPGLPAGLEQALRRFGTVPLAELAAPAARLAREGVVLNGEQAYFIAILEPILTHYEESREIYAPGGNLLAEGDLFRFPELGDALEWLGAEGAEPFYRGEIAQAISSWVLERGGTLAAADLAAYEPLVREPVRARFHGRDVLTNPPPSAGGILIAYALELLGENADEGDGTERLIAAMAAAQSARTEEFLDALDLPGRAQQLLDQARLGGAGDRLGSTTHITAVDAEGRCASVTCSNGTGSGLMVPGTGVHVNNMLGEQDLNPHGFHRHHHGRRMPSMMAPTVVVRDGELEAGLGSGGSNRIRSAVLQTIVRLVSDRLEVGEAVEAPRVHFESGVVQAEPGIDERSLARLRKRGYEIDRWNAPNVYFGGVHAVTRDPATGELAGAGDRRRGGAVATA